MSSAYAEFEAEKSPELRNCRKVQIMSKMTEVNNPITTMPILQDF